MQSKSINPAGKEKGAVIPLKVPKDMQTKIKDVAKISRLSEADIMRLSIERGIGAVEKMFEKPKEVAA